MKTPNELFAEFLAQKPPNSATIFQDVAAVKVATMTGKPYLVVPIPEILIHCQHCDGERQFEYIDQNPLMLSDFEFLRFACKNCSRTSRTIAVMFKATDGARTTRFEVMKLGEFPPFGATLRKDVEALFGSSHSDLYRRGIECERAGLGIGAMAYYRRIVEEQWKSIVSAIREAVRAVQPTDDVIADLDRVIAQVSFSKSVEELKHVLPPQLNVLGVNPLTLLHASVSADLHGASDAVCLENATATRKVLETMVDRIARAKAEQSDLAAAVKLLQLNRKES